MLRNLIASFLFQMQDNSLSKQLFYLNKTFPELKINLWNKFTQLTVSWRRHVLWPREAEAWQERFNYSLPKLHTALSPASFSTAVSPTSTSPLRLISGF